MTTETPSPAAYEERIRLLEEALRAWGAFGDLVDLVADELPQETKRLRDALGAL